MHSRRQSEYWLNDAGVGYSLFPTCAVPVQTNQVPVHLGKNCFLWFVDNQLRRCIEVLTGVFPDEGAVIAFVLDYRSDCCHSLSSFILFKMCTFLQMNSDSLSCANYVEFCCKKQMCMLILKCEEIYWRFAKKYTLLQKSPFTKN
mgnify:CR=1 FL=1